MTLAVVVPVHDNAATLEELHRRIASVLDAEGARFQLMFVDDASRDGGWQVLEELTRRDARVAAVRLDRNVGQQVAIFAGIDHVAGDPILILDADLEHPPEAIPDLLRAAARGHDLVVAVRDGDGRPRARRFGSALVNGAARLARLPGSDIGSSFLVLERRLVAPGRAFYERTGSSLLIPELVRASSNGTTIPVRSNRLEPSSYSLRRLAAISLRFVLLSLGPRLAVGSAAAGILSTLGEGCVCHRRSARLRRFGHLLLAVSALLLLGNRVARRPPQRPLYHVAERLPRSLTAPQGLATLTA